MNKKGVTVGVLESSLERLLKKKIEELGGLCLKFTSPGTIGVPDRLVIFEGLHVFVEMKRPGGRVSAAQERFKLRLEKHKARVWVVMSREDIEQLVEFIRDRSQYD